MDNESDKAVGIITTIGRKELKNRCFLEKISLRREKR